MNPRAREAGDSLHESNKSFVVFEVISVRNRSTHGGCRPLRGLDKLLVKRS
jgi:hypothetical protein